MKSRIRIRTRRSAASSYETSLSEFAEDLAKKQPLKRTEIMSLVTHFESQMAGGGIAVQEAKIEMLNAFPPARPYTSHSRKNLKGENYKR